CYLVCMLPRTLPAGFITPCLPTKTDKLRSLLSPIRLMHPPSALAHESAQRRRTVTEPKLCLFSAGLWCQHSKIGPLDSQPAATILQTQSSHRSTTTDEKCHLRPHHRSAV